MLDSREHQRFEAYHAERAADRRLVRTALKGAIGLEILAALAIAPAGFWIALMLAALAVLALLFWQPVVTLVGAFLLYRRRRKGREEPS